LRQSLWHGVFSSAVTGFTQDCFTPFVLLLGGTARHVGALNAVPNLFAALVQIKTADITAHLRSRKKILGIALFLQGLTLLLMAGAALNAHVSVWMFIALATLFTGCGAVMVPVLGSFLSDLVEQSKRGEYFGWRNKVLGFVIIGTSLVAGAILTLMKQRSHWGFAAVFAGAFVWRVVSGVFIRGMHEPSLRHDRDNSFTLFQFLRRLKESNFAKFVLFVALMNFTVNLASPFFAVLMLRDLHFSYFLYVVITVTATFTIYCTMERWGRHADKVGNLKIIKFTAPLIGFIPLLWLINRHPLFLFAAQIFSGFVWAGFNLCTANFIYDAVMPEKRTRCIAYFNVFNGLALAAGAILGGLVLPHLPEVYGNRILTLLIISSMVRIVVGTIVPLWLKEVRTVTEINNNELFFSMIGIRAMVDMDRKTIRF